MASAPVPQNTGARKRRCPVGISHRSWDRPDLAAENRPAVETAGDRISLAADTEERWLKPPPSVLSPENRFSNPPATPFAKLPENRFSNPRENRYAKLPENRFAKLPENPGSAPSLIPFTSHLLPVYFPLVGRELRGR